jgi:hypothetical protein
MAGVKIMKYFKTPNNEIHAYELDGSQDHIIPADYVQITEAEAKKIVNDKQKQLFDLLDYSKKRQMSYPSIPDQLDTLYHGGFDAWKATIQAVKNQYPKV